MKTIVNGILPLLLVAISTSLFSLSDGAFNVTGAPGEGDCSGCHTGVPVNGDANGSVQLMVENSSGWYIPGKEYKVHVRVSHASRNRFGFALTTRSGKQFEHVGSFMADAASGVFNRTEFVAHRRASIDSAQQKNWTFTWKAPENATQDIVFYIAGVAANADNDNTGDLVYTKQLTLRKSDAPTGLASVAAPSDVWVYPNPTSGYVFLQTRQSLEDITQLEVTDMQGNVIESIAPSALRAEVGGYRMEVNPEMKAGLYLLRMVLPGRTIACKLLIAG